MSVDEVIASDADALGAGTHHGLLEANPRFVDAANGDYRLRADSPAIDYPYAFTSVPDAEGRPRGIALVSTAHLYGIGAHERQDRLFASGFDDSP